MEQEKLTNENYHSTEQKKQWMGYSQFKDFQNCEVQALAIVNGEYEKPSTDALLFGSYVDAYFSNELNDFVTKHPEMFNSKTGELKASFKNVENVIQAYENDPLAKKYWSGEHQVIMTGEIEGVPVKIKIDSYFPHKAIVDGKVMKDMEPVWIEATDEDTGDKYNKKVDFIQAYRYDLEAAFYQCICEQNTGDKLPFILNVVTKEEYPDKALIQIDQEYIDAALEEIKSKIVRYDRIKKGEIEPEGCGHCPVCRSKKQLTGVMSYKRLFKKGE